jgi:hypothetical protein
MTNEEQPNEQPETDQYDPASVVDVDTGPLERSEQALDEAREAAAGALTDPFSDDVNLSTAEPDATTAMKHAEAEPSDAVTDADAEADVEAEAAKETATAQDD